MTEAPDIIAAKRALRQRIKDWRAGLPAEERSRAATAWAERGLGFLGVPPGMVVSGFAAMADEFDPAPLLHRLGADGYRLALPLVQGKGKPLQFRAWAPGDAMDSGVWGIAEPKADKAVLEPDVLLVPLLAFDASGWRLGYGGGFFDRTLRGLRLRKPILAIGLALEAQQVDAVPHLDYDEPLDWVLTPAGPMKCLG